MREHILGAAYLLTGKTTFSSRNYRDVLGNIGPRDLVYMDPPYQGVCGNRDTRYLSSVQYCEFVELLEALTEKETLYIISYDGRTGKKTHGRTLPEHLRLTHFELRAGRSSQATLLGRDDITFESLYLSPALTRELAQHGTKSQFGKSEQLALLEAR